MDDVLEEGDQQTFSIDEYIKDIEEEELEVDLILGGDQGKECTYNKGYMKRQAIFSCLTCTPNGNAGVCTACSLSCHDGHEILELWTKRNFRCDCGNSKFGVFFCKLFPNKDIENDANLYNHNFKGSYCTCGHTSTDPDATKSVEMLQCCICEDWFHEEHLGLHPPDEIPKDEEGEPAYEDFICQACSSICSFLTLYGEAILMTPKQHDATTSSEDLSAKTLICSAKNPDGMIQGESSGACVLEVDLMEAPPLMEKGSPMFVSKNWRDKLCKCERCVAFYTHKKVGFVVEMEDSIAAYEKMAKQRREEHLVKEGGMEASFLKNLGHAQKLEYFSRIADLKNEFHSFFETFDKSKAITSEDVEQVFQNVVKKRQRQL